MDLNLAGKVAVVTGAGRGIGLSVVKALAAEGVSVVAGSRTGSKDLTELAARDEVRSVSVDLTAPDGPQRLIDEAVSAFGGIDIVVNNVGAVVPRVQGFLAVTDEDWQWALTTNLMVAVRTARAALPHLIRRDTSVIVTVSSVNAFLPDPGVIDYSAAKAALSNFSKSLSKEFGPQGVRANTISPGPVTTALWLGDQGVAAVVGAAAAADPDEVVRQTAAQSATGRFTHPQEVADLVLLLASERTANVTGADFVIDGGLVQTL
ncbi:SDR family NAD(P)-dependent oxidoreductase [Nocardia jejuensis]|uniref:SDR family NAD(P)-dependent oxidoreductase n=1 Tax=Nocardia jejuensis TaxID=328049 RepID=UPI000836BCD6|nr:SDR family oxidoreductase [Nocardia jejuensis]